MTSIWLDRHRALGSDEFIPDEKCDAVVVGAGLSGLTTALLLARSGMNVTVVEGRTIGSGTSGRSTAKVSLLQGTVLSGLRRYYSKHVVDAYVEGNREGQAWLLRYLDEQGVAYQRRDAYTFAVSDSGVSDLDSELSASIAAGLEVESVSETELPFAVRTALRLKDQAQVDPLDWIEAMVRDLRGRGGRVIENLRVRNVEASDGLRVITDKGELHPELVVLGTGMPILNRGLYFAKLKPVRSYAATLRVPDPASLPRGMYLSAEVPGRSVRTVPTDGEELLMVGGNGHQTGRVASPKGRLDVLTDWAKQHFPGAEVTHAWSAQDHRSISRMPFFGKMPRGQGRIYFATGYNKWGLTNSVAAALGISSEILGGDVQWAKTLHHRVTSPRGIGTAVALNADVAKTLGAEWAKTRTQAATDVRTPPEGTGVVVTKDRPVAVSTVNGATCRLSAVCTHLGGIVTWNDAEKSWDCPLHGSRFDSDGTVLEGPATKDLGRLD